MKSGLPCGVIALMVDHTPELLVGLFGILKSGNGFVPLDPDNPVERTGFIIDNCNVEILVTEAKYLEKARSLSDKCPLLKQVVCLDEVDRGACEAGRMEVYDCADYVSERTVSASPASDPD